MMRPAYRLAMLITTTLGVAFAPPVGAVGSSSHEPASRLEHRDGRLWYPVGESALGPPDPTRRIEGKYLTLGLDRAKLTDLLARAPKERPGEVNNSDLVMELPWLDGTFRSFRVEQVSIIEPGLKVRCPDLNTYRGRGIGERPAFAHFDWGPSGFHGRISDEREVYIAPYSPGDTQHYVVYDSRDWRPPPEPTEAAPAPGGAPPAPPPTASVSSGQSCEGSIEEIAIERGCRGCENQYRLTLRRDGMAILMIVGVLSRGVLDHACTGRVTPAAFATLAALIQRDGFLDLNETYRSQLVDGQWVTTSVVVGGRRKTVVNGNKAGPPNLEMIEGAIDALGEKISWTGKRP